MLKNTWDWIKKILSDSITGALTKLLTVFLTGVFVALIGVILFSFPSLLASVYVVQGYVLVVLILFALIGVLVPSSKILSMFDELRKRKAQMEQPRKVDAKLVFEDYPREWRAQVWKSDEGWVAERIELYCTTHNLRLKPEQQADDARDKRSSALIVSVCADCKRERIKYKENLLPGRVIHSHLNWASFENELKNRFIRQAESNERI